jgi:hypothetical protein
MHHENSIGNIGLQSARKTHKRISASRRYRPRQMFNLYNRLRGNRLTDVGIEIKPVAAFRRRLGGQV